MEEQNLSIIITQDQSPTIKHHLFEEHYHSTFGAIQESNHIFIKAGIEDFQKKPSLNILELGFGTGLNVWLACLYALKNRMVIHIDSYEKFPISNDVHQKYIDILNQSGRYSSHEMDYFYAIQKSNWNEVQIIDPLFSYAKYEADIESLNSNEAYDIIFFDAFNPDVQPELWTEEVFRMMYRALKQNGIIVTYCAKGLVRRNMKSVGFCIEKLQGPPGKREITRGEKICANNISSE